MLIHETEQDFSYFALISKKDCSRLSNLLGISHAQQILHPKNKDAILPNAGYPCNAILQRYLNFSTPAKTVQRIRNLNLHRTDSSSPPSDSLRSRCGTHALCKIRLIPSLSTSREPSTDFGRALASDKPGSGSERAVVVGHGVRNANSLCVHFVESRGLHVAGSLSNNTGEVVLVVLEVSRLKEHDGDEGSLLSDLGDLVLGEGV
jgi:hypothetical protein